ncbi:hypothetical protein O181_079309 [Austropuccinia psidii MF-1]|uniref:Uncharacterized protein n=1 Tax=Austropuccinia psidii MF-1 TaxID=1389203 RepID=A0A9Q3FI86_9BASI|nr:hypothetical protein [Austropuccinia psidii MF-1]
MTSLGTIIKEIIIPHGKVNIRLKLEFLVLEDSQIQGFLLGTDYQRMYGIDTLKSKNRHITIERKISSKIANEQNISLLKILRKSRPAFSLGEEPSGNDRGHDIELYMDVERTHPPILRRPPYTEILETRKEIEKHVNELLDMDVIRKMENNEILEVTTPVLITWNDGKSRLC